MISDKLGQNGFVWWVGVVEDRIDPLALGRLKVRIAGWHTTNKAQIPTSALPWASVMLPIHSASMHGIGVSPTGPVEGTHVVGFFRDGESGQDPVVMGTLVGIPQVESDPTNGFNDPNGVYPKAEFVGEPDTNRLSRNDSENPHDILQLKESTRALGVPKAMSGTWDQPSSPYKAAYPFNHTIETESGHVIELDDSEGAERLHIYHRSGTFHELHPNGTSVSVVRGSEYNIINLDSFAHVRQNLMLTVGQNVGVRINNAVDVHVIDGTIHIKIEKGDANIELMDGNMTSYVNGDVEQTVTGNAETDIEGDYSIKVGGKLNIRSRGIMNLRGARINLN